MNDQNNINPNQPEQNELNSNQPVNAPETHEAFQNSAASLQDTGNPAPYENTSAQNGNPYSQTSNQPPVQSQINPYYNPNQEPPKQSSGLSIASMVLGIISIVSCCVACLSIPLGILAVIFGIIGVVKNQPGKGMAVAGIITGGISIAAVVVLYILIAAGTVEYDTYFSDFNNLNDFTQYAGKIFLK